MRRYPEPPAPALPRAGGKFFDPTFGTEIMRVTDESGGGNAGTSYSYWPTFNRNNTKLLVQHADYSTGVIYDFNPINFTLGAKNPPIPNTPDGQKIRGEDAIWSSIDPDTLYCHTDNGAKLWRYRVSTRTFKLVKDLSSFLMGGARAIYQMSKSTDDDVFAATMKRGAPSYAEIGYIVYQVSRDKVLTKALIAPYDEVQLDKSGRYLVVKLDPRFTPGVVRTHILDLSVTPVIDTSLTWGPPDYSTGHSDNGTGVVFGGEDHTLSLTKRSLERERVHSFSKLFSFGEPNGLHISALADNESWVLVSTYGGTPSGRLQNELVQFSTDGLGRVRRLAHHHSIYQSYFDSPRANISRDGRFIAFTSNWGGKDRRDLFIARITPAPASTPTTRQRRISPINQ